MPVNVLLLFSLRKAIICTNGDLKISLHVYVRKIAIILWKFHILDEFLSCLSPKFYLSLKSRQYFMFFIFICKHFNSFLVFNLCISQKVRLNLLLVARYFLLVCSLLVTFCSLLLTFYSLLAVRYFLLVPRYFLLVARRSLLFARYFLLVCSLLTVK